MSSSGSLLTLIMLLILFATPPVGLMLLVFGLRGRRVGYEPRCRRCRYNLTGLMSKICPECGADLKATDATAIGLRKRRTALLFAGAALLLFGVAAWSVRIYGQANQVDWYRYYPAGMLNTAITNGDRKALNELDRRYFADELSESAISGFIAKALEIQGAEERHRLMHPSIDLLYQMVLDGHVTPADEQQFYQQLVQITMEVRPRIRHGEPLTIQLNVSHRGGESWQFPAFQRNMRLLLDDHVVLEQEPESHWGTTLGFGGYSRTGTRDYDPDGIPPGAYQVKRTWEIHVYPAYTGVAYLTIDPNTVEPLAVVPLRCIAPVEILPADAEDLVAMTDRPGLKEQMAKLIKVDQLRVISARKTEESEIALDVRINLADGPAADPLPIGVAFDVIALVDGTEYQLGHVSRKQGPGINTGFTGALPDLEGDTIDILLRANRDIAKRSIDIYEIWDGELLFENVKVQR